MSTNTTTAAAELLHTSQPTISRELARIEKIAGFALFNRIRGRLQPTEEAFILFEEIKSSYIGLDRFYSTLKHIKEKKSGVISLVAQPTFSHILIPGACKRFNNKTDCSGINISFEETPFLERKLTNQLFDVGLTERDDAPEGTDLIRLFKGNEVCVIPSNHALLKKKSVGIEDLAKHNFISLAANDPYRIKLDNLCDRQGIKRNNIIETASATSLCCLVRSGLGIGIVNPLTAYDFLGKNLHIRPLTFEHSFNVSLIIPKRRTINSLTNIFIEVLKDETKDIITKLSYLGIDCTDQY